MRVITKPVISEKSVAATEQGKYTFVVSRDADKQEIKKAVEEHFKVKVVDIHIMRVKGKAKSFRRIQGTRPTVKKAIVRLAKGDKIDLFEGAK